MDFDELREVGRKVCNAASVDNSYPDQTRDFRRLFPLLVDLAEAVDRGQRGLSPIGEATAWATGEALRAAMSPAPCPVCGEPYSIVGLKNQCGERLQFSSMICTADIGHSSDHCGHSGGRRIASWPRGGEEKPKGDRMNYRDFDVVKP